MRHIALIMMFLVLLPSSLAQTDQELAGSTPDSTIAWGLDRAIERVELLLSQDKDSTRLKHAQERLAEARLMILQNKAEHAERALNKGRELKNDITNKEKNNKIDKDLNSTETRFEIKFAFGQEHLNKIINKVNPLLASDLGQRLQLNDGLILFKVKNPKGKDRLFYASVKGKQIESIEESKDVRASMYQFELSHGEFYSIPNRNSASLVALGNRFINQAQERAQTGSQTISQSVIRGNGNGK